MMAKRIENIDEMRPNVFEAIKRAYIKKGVVPRARRVKQTEASASKKTDNSHQKTHKLAKNILSKPSKSPDQEAQEQEPKSPKPDTSLHEITYNAQDVLFEATTIFPFTLVPDTITLDREKLTIANRFFWKTANITSTPVSEIMSCEANVGPIFGSIHLTFRFFADNQRSINFFWREDALNFQRIMHGYIIANRKEVDTSHIPTDELIDLLEELGTGASD